MSTVLKLTGHERKMSDAEKLAQWIRANHENDSTDVDDLVKKILDKGK
jgi:hypothetical protein